MWARFIVEIRTQNAQWHGLIRKIHVEMYVSQQEFHFLTWLLIGRSLCLWFRMIDDAIWYNDGVYIDLDLQGI